MTEKQTTTKRRKPSSKIVRRAHRPSFQSILPRGASFHAETTRNGAMKFVYEETFHPSQIPPHAKKLGVTVKSMVADVIAAFRNKLPPTIFIEAIRGGVRLRGTASQGAIGNMMASEFFAWGSVGQMKIADLIAAGILHA